MKNKHTEYLYRGILFGMLCLGIMVYQLYKAVLPAEAGTVTAADMAVFKGVSVSPNGMAWTTDYMDKTNERLPHGYTIETGIASGLPALRNGEHYYRKPAEGSVNIGKWVVAWPGAQCIHNYEAMNYMGYSVEAGFCGSPYNNGWNAYCADCGENVTILHIYAKSDTVRQIKSMPAQSVYLYLCPHCRGLEQGAGYQHICKEISANRYAVSYQKNAPAEALVTGYMPDTYHMFNNAELYEGESAKEQGYGDTRLRANGYSCIGYVFTGWNTEADGSGQAFTDGEDIWNLTEEEGGTVPLYAQWSACKSTLIIDANGGTYNGQSQFQVEQAYHTTYVLQENLLIPGEGYTVSFETNGGSSVETLNTDKAFSHWEAQGALSGILEDRVYTFGQVDGSVDTVKAQYYNVSFQLPESVKEKESLTGWYTEPDFREDSFVGKPGEEISVDRDSVLYAKWAALTLWAQDDYESHSGVGAVDLSWEYQDETGKYYKLYQSTDAVSWTEIHTAGSIGNAEIITEYYDSNRQGETYIIDAQGYYTLTAVGAKGADYNSTYTGGKGGSVKATYWLKKGDILTFYAGTEGEGIYGGMNGSNASGGDAGAVTGRGGGAGTEIYLTRNGTDTVLLVAGGGGGGNEKASGKSGGLTFSDIGAMHGSASDYGGGGGGAQGGLGGTYMVHNHEGNTNTGGGCYIAQTGIKVCGTAYEAIGGYWECACGETWGVASNNYFKEKHASCLEQYWMPSVYMCSGCQTRLQSGETHSVSYTYYVLNCSYKDKPDGYVIGADPAQGGSSYIHTGYGCKNASGTVAEHAGAGYAFLESVDIGYREETTLPDVLAKDTAAPGKIHFVQLSLAEEQQIKVSFARPEDHGSMYYHLAKSFANEETVRLLATSNITQNLLTTGIAGYYYYIDLQEQGEVNSTCEWLTEEELVVTMTTDIRYLHIAAMDKAGNIGETCHIKLQSENLPTDEDYPDVNGLYTEKLSLRESEFVYSTDGQTYFVKADGVTEHRLQGMASIDGTATQDYQVDSLRLNVLAQEDREWLQITVPHGSIALNRESFSNDTLCFSSSGAGLNMLSPSLTFAERTGHGATLNVTQDFTVQPEQEVFQIYPQAVAVLREKKYYSDSIKDMEHGLVLIPDGITPKVEGLEALQSFDILDMTEQTKHFTLRAYDNESGLQTFKVIVSNRDNFMEGEFSADDEGEILLEVDKENPLFMGEILISAIAVDRVGNVNHVGEDGLTFTLEATISRERNPKEPVFKTGDGAILSITTTGYADRVEVIFPEEFLTLYPDLNRVYEYEYPYLQKTEIIPFHIPLGTPEQEYEIIVKAWKNGQMLISKPTLILVEGNVLDELRTRIRNNG